jgi:hypothetical protein
MLLVCTVYSVLHSETAVSRKPLGIGHMYIYTFLLRMTDTVTFQNIDLSSRDILYRREHPVILLLDMLEISWRHTRIRLIQMCMIFVQM